MSDILLAKPELPEGTIDCSVGEPHIVRDILDKYFDFRSINLRGSSKWTEYPNSTGNKSLLKILEDKYQSPVIVTNGAKQALGACFYALSQMGKNSCAMRSPYWALIPPLMKMHNLKPQFIEGDNSVTESAEAYLCLAPNNPDGFVPAHLSEMASFYKERGVPFIHDAAYYTHTYLPGDYELKSLGDAQIYSVSKMLGISGARVGFVVCHNPVMYSHIKSYMEAMTVGVSNISQLYVFNLLSSMAYDADSAKRFEQDSFAALQKAKKIFSQVSPEILNVPSNLESVPGMFLWAKVMSKANFQKSKIHVVNGAPFGVPGMVRMNMAFNESILNEIVSRLNEVAHDA
jgi:aspartate/methionine/tyrosine aminotransferase